jgi:hypothetical protein
MYEVIFTAVILFIGALFMGFSGGDERQYGGVKRYANLRKTLNMLKALDN